MRVVESYVDLSVSEHGDVGLLVSCATAAARQRDRLSMIIWDVPTVQIMRSTAADGQEDVGKFARIVFPSPVCIGSLPLPP
jgi:hypothetical protein